MPGRLVSEFVSLQEKVSRRIDDSLLKRLAHLADRPAACDFLKKAGLPGSDIRGRRHDAS